MKLTGPGRRPGVRRSAHAAACRQGAPCRRGGGDGGRRNAGAGDGCRGGRRGRIRGAAVRRFTPRTRSSPARRRSGTKCQTTCRRHDVRRQGGDRPRVRRSRPCREGRLPCGSRHRRAAGAARSLGGVDTTTGRYTLYAGPAARCGKRRELAGVLGIPPDKLRVLSYDVGGNFGTRNRAFVEFGLVLWAARKIGRPVKYTATRSESFLTDYQGRDLVTKVELALRHHRAFPGDARRPTSAMSARAACRSRRCRRAPA